MLASIFMNLPVDLEALLKREDNSVEWKKTGDARENR